VRTFRIIVVVLLALLSAEQGIRAQSLAHGLFERYLDPLRTQAGIPGLAAAIVQNGRVVLEREFGSADVERAVPVRPDTPFFIADVSQMFGATLLMQSVARGELTLDDRLSRWTSVLPEPAATVRQALTHTTTGSYAYDPRRFAALTQVIEASHEEPYRLTLVREILGRLAMTSSAPGHDFEQPSPAMRELFEPGELARFQNVVGRMALPYRVDGRRRATRSEFPVQPVDASTGIVSTVGDLARFDAALDDGILLDRDHLAYMRTGAQPGTPTGLGWFVQAYNGERLVWHFGLVPGAYSSLFLKVPSRNLTLILLANSDGLSSPFALERGDVTSSLFAKLFLSLFVS
jgi:CubicO group peptidase (beta-lactamase class C family)